jgi:2-(1,2-epoxy-1,2-dihydrophenyl)acetyl-CoA isomerase
VVAPAQLAESAENMLQRLAQGPTGSFAAVKQLMLVSSTNALEDHLALEARTIIARSQTEEGREGVRAFVEKRKPVFLLRS